MATRWGIASAGRISHDFVLAVTATLPQDEHQICAVAARCKQRAQEFAKKHKIPQSYGSYEELARDPEIEIVYVGAINTEHFKLVKLFLENGKHVLCEKPMGMNKKEVEEMVKCAKEKNLLLVEAIWSRFFPAYIRIKELISSGKIGEVLNVQAQFGTCINEVPRVAQKDLGGSAILDIGVYVIQFVFYILGKPIKVKAVGQNNSEGVDEVASAVFLYPGGKQASITIDTRARFVNEAKIQGTKGTIVVSAPFHCPTQLITPDGTEDFPLPNVDGKFEFGNSCGLRYEAVEIRKCLKNGSLECPFVNFEESLNIAEIEDEIRKQINEL